MPKINLYTLNQANGSQLFAVHAAGGMVYAGKLARHLNSRQGFYAVQGEGLDRADTGLEFSSMSQLGTLYAAAIAERCGQEPIYLCSRYGAILIETGHQLRKLGIQVSALIVFDSRAPIFASKAEPTWAKKMFIDPIRQFLQISDSVGLKSLFKRKITKSEDKRAVQRSSKRKAQNPFRLTNGRLMRGYSPERYDHRIILIRSGGAAKTATKNLGRISSWQKFTEDLQCYTVPGSHRSMWNGESIKMLGKLVQSIVDDLPHSEIQHLESGFLSSHK